MEEIIQTAAETMKMMKAAIMTTEQAAIMTTEQAAIMTTEQAATAQAVAVIIPTRITLNRTLIHVSLLQTVTILSSSGITELQKMN